MAASVCGIRLVRRDLGPAVGCPRDGGGGIVVTESRIGGYGSGRLAILVGIRFRGWNFYVLEDSADTGNLRLQGFDAPLLGFVRHVCRDTAERTGP